MNKYDLACDFTQLDGTVIKGNNIAKLLAEILSNYNGQELNCMKAMAWALTLFNDDFIEIDDVDKKQLIAFIEKTEYLKNIAKVQIINKLDV